MNEEAVDLAIRVLNEALALDHDAMDAMFLGHRIICNDKLGEHWSVQVNKDGAGEYTVGVLGLINGLFGVDDRDWGHIALETDEAQTHIICFRRTRS